MNCCCSVNTAHVAYKFLNYILFKIFLHFFFAKLPKQKNKCKKQQHMFKSTNLQIIFHVVSYTRPNHTANEMLCEPNTNILERSIYLMESDVSPGKKVVIRR